MVVPLSILNHFKPARHLPPEKQLHELFPYGTEHSNLGLPFDKKLFTWKNFFLGWNSVAQVPRHAARGNRSAAAR